MEWNHQPAQYVGRPVKQFVLVFILTILVLISLFCKIPAALYPNHIYGVIMDTRINPDGSIWILTDDSFRFYAKTRSLSYTSSGLHRIFCQTDLYLYNPVEKRVLKKIVTKLDDFPRKCSLAEENGHLWQIFETGDMSKMIRVFDASSGDPLLDTNQFLAGHNELKQGIAAINYKDQQKLIELETKDARKFIYLLDDHSLIPDTQEAVNKNLQKHYAELGRTNIFAFMNEDSNNSSRKMLYRVSGEAAKLSKETLLQNLRIDNLDTGYLTGEDFEYSRLTPEAVYLEPILIYQDNDLVVFLHQDQIGADARRMLTCVNSEGIRKWTVPPDQLFPELMLKKSNAFSDKFFMQDNVKGEKAGKTFVLQVRDCGLEGFDIDSGQKLWQLKIQ
ncbi:Hypothetical protein LUCI_4346 [Lucifera butyrica]|uniref:Uncharacterized protein n=1 Tax=Lucifera butyrica TaxID=1351585 RepID=A0A498RE11_9FIRM|nr:hypothetical protein [Lucifera butyrica]VBB09060.1 Hypothetical protein LUCI_4346 [Lucifera butyrica]